MSVSLWQIVHITNVGEHTDINCQRVIKLIWLLKSHFGIKPTWDRRFSDNVIYWTGSTLEKTECAGFKMDPNYIYLLLSQVSCITSQIKLESLQRYLFLNIHWMSWSSNGKEILICHSIFYISSRYHRDMARFVPFSSLLVHEFVLVSPLHVPVFVA